MPKNNMAVTLKVLDLFLYNVYETKQLCSMMKKF